MGEKEVHRAGQVAGSCSTGSCCISSPASAESWVVLPYGSGASATKPSAARRLVTSAMWLVRPYHSWVTMTPAPEPPSGSAG